MQDDPLYDLINRDISESVDSLTVIQGKAKQTGNPYTCLLLKFSNGYSTRIFLDSGGKFAVAQAVNNN